MSTPRLRGRVAVVTGAASGIGRAIAVQLADDGANVVAADVNQAGLQETLGLVPEAAKVVTVVGDLREPAAI